MNFLLSMPNDGQSNNYIINALQDMEHEVFFIDHRAHFEICMENVPQFLHHEKIDIMLVLFLAKDSTYTVQYINELKGRFPHVKYVAWVFDATLDGEYCDENKRLVSLAKAYDYFFTVCRGQVESFKQQGVNAFHVPEGACKYMYDLSKDLFVREEYDVSFIGQVGNPEVHQERVPLLKAIGERFSNLKIFGPVYTEDPDILKFHVKRPTFNDIEHSKIVAKSRINLAHSGWPEIEGYFSARAYRIMKSGGFVLHNKTNNIESYFDIDEDIVLYKDIEECLEKIAYYLSNPERRKEIAQNGHDVVCSKYLFENSMEKLLEIIK